MPSPPHYAYRIAIDADQRISDHPLYRNSLSLIGHIWNCTTLPDGTTLITLPGGSNNPDDYGPAQDLSDGVQFLPPADLAWVTEHATWRELQREDAPASVDVTLCSGHLVSIGLGLQAPQLLTIQPGRAHAGQHTTDLGRLAWELFDRYNSPDPDIPDELALSETGWLQYLSIAATYKITPEACNAFEILTTGDTLPMLLAIWGADPKACAAADDTSPSPAAALSPIPS